MLGAVWEGTAADGKKAGLSEAFAERFLLPLGVMARFRLLACGWRNPGDNFKRADDASWWKQPHISGAQFWANVGTYVDTLGQVGIGGNWNLDESAIGSQASIATELARAQDDLGVIQAAKADICLPYFPATARGALPSPNLVCLAKVKGEKDVKPVLDELITLFGISLPWWAWIGLGYVASRAISKR